MLKCHSDYSYSYQVHSCYLLCNYTFRNAYTCSAPIEIRRIMAYKSVFHITEIQCTCITKLSRCDQCVVQRQSINDKCVDVL